MRGTRSLAIAAAILLADAPASAGEATSLSDRLGITLEGARQRCKVRLLVGHPVC